MIQKVNTDVLVYFRTKKESIDRSSFVKSDGIIDYPGVSSSAQYMYCITQTVHN